jgi:hypothetical protein
MGERPERGADAIREVNMRTILATLASLVVLSGCSTSHSDIKECISCRAEVELLKSCDLPIEIKDGVTYLELIDLINNDRENLRKCGTSYNTLLEIYNTCNQKIDDYNKGIREIDASMKRR